MYKRDSKEVNYIAFKYGFKSLLFYLLGIAVIGFGVKVLFSKQFFGLILVLIGLFIIVSSDYILSFFLTPVIKEKKKENFQGTNKKKAFLLVKEDDE